MDLSVSPDLDARWCYLIVLLCGLISARSQLYKRFVDFKVSGAWLVPSTWLVFAIYLAIPIALFWLMDRMNALNDTSLFAALLVGRVRKSAFHVVILQLPHVTAKMAFSLRVAENFHPRRQELVAHLQVELDGLDQLVHVAGNCRV